MQFDFSTEKIATVAVAILVYLLAKAFGAPDWLPIVALVLIVGWGPDILRRLRR